MASTSREPWAEGVEFVHEDDGTVTARDIETGLARGGATRAEALAQLAEVLALATDEGDTVEDVAAFLEENDIEPASNVERPP